LKIVKNGKFRYAKKGRVTARLGQVTVQNTLFTKLSKNEQNYFVTLN